VEDYYKNLSGDFPAPPSASEIERLSVDETVAAMLAEQRRRKDEAKRLAEEKRKAKEKRMAEIDAKRQNLEVKPIYQGVMPPNERAPEGKSRVGDELDKAEEDQSNEKKQGAGWDPANADKPTEKAGGSVDGMKAAEKTNGRAVTDQHAQTNTHNPTKQRGAETQKPANQQAAEKSDKYQKKFCCCIIM